MATPFATATDLAARWRPLSTTGPAPTEQDRATTLLGDASVWIRAWLPGIDQRIASGDLDANLVTLVACAMVKRSMIGSDHEGQRGSMDVMGPFTSQATFTNPEGNLYLTSVEVDQLDGRPSGAVSMECVGM